MRFATRFGIVAEKGKPYVGVHVQTETNYSLRKELADCHWKECFFKIPSREQGVEAYSFWICSAPVFEGEGIVDLRGRHLFLKCSQSLKIVVDYMLLPDSGVLSIAYYIDATFPFRYRISLGRSKARSVQAERCFS